MFVIKAYAPAVTLLARDGSARVFQSMSTALQQLGIGWIANNIAANFSDVSPAYRCLLVYDLFGCSYAAPSLANFVMRDEAANKITADDFYQLNSALCQKQLRRSRSRQSWNGKGPVPGTGRSASGHYFRRPRTFNERRLSQAIASEPAGRSKRNRIPSDFDDIAIASRGVRSWKRHRNHQWKV